MAPAVEQPARDEVECPIPRTIRQINQSSKGSRAARAGADCTNEVDGRLVAAVGEAHQAIVEVREPRAVGIGGERRRRPIAPPLCGAADRGKIGVDTRLVGTGRCLPRLIQPRVGVGGVGN